MSTRTAEGPTSGVKPYKKILKQLESLRGAAGEAIFERGSLLIQVFNDQDFRFDLNCIDDFAAFKILDGYIGDVCLSFQELRDMITDARYGYPDRAKWVKGNLRTMYNEMCENRSRPEPRIKPTRDRATLADVEKLKTEKRQIAGQLKKVATERDEFAKAKETLAAKLTTCESTKTKALTEVEKLRQENGTLRARIKELEGEVSRLERQLQRRAA